MWFAAWMLVGAGFSLGVLSILSIGLFLLVASALGTVFLAVRGHAGRSMTGLISGPGIPSLYVAYLNRQGPGTACTAIESGEQCSEYWNPWPFAIVGIALIAAGVLLHVVVARKREG